MQTTRFPSPALSMARRRLGVGGILFVGGFIAMFAAKAFASGYIVMLAGGAAIALGIPILRRAWDAYQGHLGELAVDRELEALDDRYRLLCNYCPEGKVGDADRVLFGPHGILLIEVKTYSRPIRIHGESWSVQLTGGQWRRIKSPFLQATRCAKALEKEFGGKVLVVVAVPSGASIEAVDSAMPVVRFRDIEKYVTGLEAAVRTLDEDRVRRLWAA